MESEGLGPAISGYAAVVGTIALLWNVWIWLRARRPRAELDIIPSLTKKGKPKVTLIVRNVGEKDFEISNLTLHSFEFCDAKDLTSEIQSSPIYASHHALPPNRSISTKITGESLRDLGNGIDDEIRMEVLLGNGQRFVSKKVVPSLQIDILRWLHAHGGSVVGTTTKVLYENFGEFSANSTIERILRRYERRGWIEVHRASAGGEIDSITFRKLPHEVPEDYRYVRWFNSMKSEVDENLTWRSRSDFIDLDARVGMDDLVREWQEMYPEVFNVNWDAYGLIDFQIDRDRAEQVTGADAIVPALEELVRNGSMIEHVESGRISILYSNQGLLTGISYHNPVRDFAKLTSDDGVEFVARDDAGWRRFEMSGGKDRDGEFDTMHDAMLRWLTSSALTELIQYGRAKLVRDADGNVTGFEVSNGVSVNNGLIDLGPSPGPTA